MDSIDYYDRYAVPYYEETVELSMEEQLERFMKLLPENAEVLDLGCGSGRDTLFFEEEGFSVTAMDGSEKMCELAEIHTGRDSLKGKPLRVSLSLQSTPAQSAGLISAHRAEMGRLPPK